MNFLDYAPAPESQAILNLQSDYGLFIDGEFVAGRGTPFSTINPATEEPIESIAMGGAEDVDAAVARPEAGPCTRRRSSCRAPPATTGASS